MQVSDAISKRRAIRAYSDKPVPQELIDRIFQQAQAAPSNCNIQPWHVAVFSGDARNQLEKGLLTEVTSGAAPAPYFQPGDHGLKDQYKQRQRDCASSLYDAVDVKYEEKDKRQELIVKNWQFFGAPHVAFISMPKFMKETNAVDVGIYLQTLMLLMTENGISCCPQGALAMFTQSIHEAASIPEDNAIIVGLSFGYADDDAPINNFEVGRAELVSAVQFLD